MQSRMLAAIAAAALVLSAPHVALAQAQTGPTPDQSGADSSMAKPDKTAAPRNFSTNLPKGTPDVHNSTTGAASTDVPTPSVVTHILSGQDAAKFNAEAAADDAKPTLAHALALTDEQRQWIAGLIGNAGPGTKAEFKPERAALIPPSAKASVKDLPPEIAAKIPWLKPVQFAVVDNEILLVDPGNSFLVLDIVKR